METLVLERRGGVGRIPAECRADMSRFVPLLYRLFEFCEGRPKHAA